MAVVKTVQDYYNEMFELFPTLPKKDIKRACMYGFKSLYLHNSYGGDVNISRKNFKIFFGKLTNNSLKHFSYYINKMRVKLRVLHKRKKIKWDGYYYFALTSKLYLEYLLQKNKRGRPRKNFTFEKVFLYKIFDECNIVNYGKVAIFRIPASIDTKYCIYKPVLTTSKAELVLEREPLKFKDVLLSTYDYEFISDALRKYKKKINE